MVDDYALAYKKITELAANTGAPASGDFAVRYDASIGGPVKVDPTDLNAFIGVTATAAEIDQACDESANTEVVTTTNVLTAAESGKTIILNSTSAFVTTLPAKAAGLRFKFYTNAIVTGGNHTIVPDSSDDNTIYGQAIVAGAVVLATVEGSINFIADLTLPGDWVELFNDGTNWYVSGQIQTASGLTFTT
tara:strand:+ start:3356 stop:3928 length:573 start_codon:yes stop_codon:yes gene_type:complete